MSSSACRRSRSASLSQPRRRATRLGPLLAAASCLATVSPGSICFILNSNQHLYQYRQIGRATARGRRALRRGRGLFTQLPAQRVSHLRAMAHLSGEVRTCVPARHAGAPRSRAGNSLARLPGSVGVTAGLNLEREVMTRRPHRSRSPKRGGEAPPTRGSLSRVYVCAASFLLPGRCLPARRRAPRRPRHRAP